MISTSNGIGMVSSLGWDAATACAAARAGLSRAKELSLLNLSQYSFFGKENLDGFPPIKGHACPLLGEGFTGVGKVVELGRMAFSKIPNPRELNSQVGVSICINDFELLDRFEEKSPELFYELNLFNSEQWFLQCEGVVDLIINNSAPQLNDSVNSVYYGGHAVVGQMLQDAVLKMDNEGLECVLVGAVDSIIDTQMVIAAAYLGLLNTENNPVGFFPGELSGFLFLSKDINGFVKLGNNLRLDYVNHKSFASGLFEDPISTGKDLAFLIMDAIESSNLGGSDEVKQVILDASGLEWYSHEWANTQLKLNEKGIDFSYVLKSLPALSFGEVGAAAGVVALGVAEQGYLRGYFKGKTLILLSSWSGERSAILVSEG